MLMEMLKARLKKRSKKRLKEKILVPLLIPPLPKKKNTSTTYMSLKKQFRRQIRNVSGKPNKNSKAR